jgi:hypothetical protein
MRKTRPGVIDRLKHQAGAKAISWGFRRFLPVQ